MESKVFMDNFVVFFNLSDTILIEITTVVKNKDLRSPIIF